MESKEEINKENIKKTVRQDQIHSLLFNREIGWQEIIYDLINTEQLDPWDINITILTEKYLDRIKDLEEADFFISSKVLLAAALLLRIKSEILLNKYIKSIDEILFGKKEEKKYFLERIELDEEIPELIPKSPLPRFKKVTLQELMESLNKAIKTENRRITKEIINKNALRESSFSLPKRKYSIKDKIREIYEKLFGQLNKDEKKKISFTELIGKEKEERIASFSPLLHLDTQKKVWLEQENHFDEINIWLSDVYFKNNPDIFADLKNELEEEIEEEAKEQEKINEENNETEKRTSKITKKEIKKIISKEEKEKRLEKINNEFNNPLKEMME